MVEGGGTVNNPVVERIKSMIDKNLEMDMSLGEIAKRIGISVYYMSHIFKKYAGMTVVEYRTFRRMEKAKHELLYTGKSITEIAFSCGFSSQGYFSERFAKTVGVSPTVYRNANKI